MCSKCVLRSFLFGFICIGIENTIIPYKMECKSDQEYRDCASCEKTCFNQHLTCNNTCVAGCFCKSGLLRAPNGKCVESKFCPSAQATIGYDLTIEECLPDEVFVWCGWCEGTCADPRPRCPDVCTHGCVCRPPLLRHYSGNCVEEAACAPKRCLDPNMEYGCRYGCEATCSKKVCVRPSRCRLGCHCKLGWYKDNQGRCVTYDQCLQNMILNH